MSVHHLQPVADLGELEIGRFLSSLATVSHVSASTQNQALNALLFLYHDVLENKVGLIEGVGRAKRAKRLPVVLTKEEVQRLLGCLSHTPLADGDVDARRRPKSDGMLPLACEGSRSRPSPNPRSRRKGDKDRYTTLPTAARQHLAHHLQRVKSQHEEDFREGLGRVALPQALGRKYPSAGKEWGWQ